ncbi:neuropilin and tolloid-like protein 2 [Nilaparvata lugens]|uniref:neuropilin and tolloid-like protein 2 n=1 Tax=Nilaparvata lugens TaxID=108931 RepID=UPI000B981B55|nr:neuropilin and tolloid-like protein 2 [Nilaparvata lugens]XP_022193783.1 neuropilin and tolloid-like protein 2 [Nilaparvata lugens]XP_039298965.1 neuropilin and tolloid-like protein 2 [Nilaparvata lugens]
MPRRKDKNVQGTSKVILLFNLNLLFIWIPIIVGVNPVSTSAVIGEEMVLNPACTSFQIGDPEKNEFYSPNYPGLYPNHTDCIKIITAESGNLLRLDFRDSFNVEPSEDCRFDYLEVRDGAHGYSTRIGLFCGHDFPPVLTSSDRYLWLRFHSDETIEYTGFKAVYSQIPKPTGLPGEHPELGICRIETEGYEGFVNRSDIDPERVRTSLMYGVPLDCMWVIRVQEGWRIQLHFSTFSLERPNDCDSNFIDIFSEKTDLPSRLYNFCGSIAELVQSPGNVLHLRFMAEAKAVNSSFEALFTAFRLKDKDKGETSCREGEYDCEDATCIMSDLKCNGRINCRFKWDEDDCLTKTGALTDHMIIILTIFFLILTGMCCTFLFNCFRKLVRDHRIIQAQLRESRESHLEQLGRKTPAGAVITPLATVLSNSANSESPANIRSVSPPRLRNTVSPQSVKATAARGDCYVPVSAGDLLPIVVKQQSNCSSSLARDEANAAIFKGYGDRGDSTSADIDDVDQLLLPDDLHLHLPEMRDSECQTRESLFHNSGYTPNTSTGSRTPPPPPLAARCQHQHSSTATDQQQVTSIHDSRSTPDAGSFTTFGYGRNHRQSQQVPSAPPVPAQQKANSQRFRAEAVIQMDKYAAAGGGGSGATQPVARPYSVDSTKSAPDVIVTH